MKISSKTGIFPWFTLIEGFVGFSLMSWLLSGRSAEGLLPKNHLGGILCFVFFAVTLVICWLGVQNVAQSAPYDVLFSASVPAAAGIGLGAVGFLISAFSVPGEGPLRAITPAVGVLAAVALGYTACCRFKGLRPNFLSHYGIVIYLILRTMCGCGVWSAQTQLFTYFFPLLSCLLLMMAGYYRAVLDAPTGNPKRYIFFSQAALFCCCVSCAGRDWLFYLSCALWMASDYCALPYAGRYTK